MIGEPSAADATLATYRKYADLLRSMLAKPASLNASAEDADSMQVERGIVWPRLLCNPIDPSAIASVDSLLPLSASPGQIESIKVIDAAGHLRTSYRPLLVYSWLRAFDLVYETLPRIQFGRWDGSLRPWCHLLETRLQTLDAASVAQVSSEMAWIGLALHSGGKILNRLPWCDLATDIFRRLVAGQQSSGEFVGSDASTNPETHAYEELVLLHATASYAVQAENREAAIAVARATEFHQANTQPDHATLQPWAVFAFIWNPVTRPYADQLLHLVGTQPTGLSLMLLADAVYCLELFNEYSSE